MSMKQNLVSPAEEIPLSTYNEQVEDLDNVQEAPRIRQAEQVRIPVSCTPSLFQCRRLLRMPKTSRTILSNDLASPMLRLPKCMLNMLQNDPLPSGSSPRKCLDGL